ADDTILLDIAGLERIFGPADVIARELAQRAAEVGITANVAAAANIDAAIHAARGFSGVTMIAAGEEAERLGSLPIEVLTASFAELQPSAASKKLPNYAATGNQFGSSAIRQFSN